MFSHGEGASAAHTDDHHHSDDQHSHGDDHHSHGDDQHPHSGEHHSHGDEHHHSGEHSHGGDDHSHDSHDHYHDSHSHSHSHDGHGSHSSHEEDGHHHHDHKDSHEKEDDLQQSQQGADLQQVPQGAGPVAEPVIVPSVARSHNSHVTSGSSSFKPLPLMNNYHHHHHHHHDNEPRRNRSRVVVMPKYSEYDLYEFAICNVQPNRAIPVEQQQEITGQVTLWQRQREGYRDGPRNFEPLSDDEDDTSASNSSANFRSTPAGGRLATTYACVQQAAYTADLQWNRISNLRPSGSEVETLPLGHRGLRDG
ncbi:hypothetical protein AVEN_24545-1 [Araneus ventricosus]|uniref:Uncharacterized protein n=1 Tax=Araneus ventricosus TaxID=182803 RepID=A0A4Y2VV55_ARAVE|nr:hypothetical protein AVEN_24545-1 [Araneus ventricosus]